jgi:hypothetical protein
MLDEMIDYWMNYYTIKLWQVRKKQLKHQVMMLNHR